MRAFAVKRNYPSYISFHTRCTERNADIARIVRSPSPSTSIRSFPDRVRVGSWREWRHSSETPPGALICNSSNLIRQSLLVSETGPGAGRGSHPRWDRDPPSGETEISE